MSFAKKTWKDGEAGKTPITADDLNRLEQAIANNDASVTSLSTSKLDAPAAGTTAGYVPTVQANGSVAYAAQQGGGGTGGSATKLATARSINGVPFDGTADITITDPTKVPTTRTVNGKALSGNISITASDLGLGAVNNTADADKPISTATQAALDAKANATDVPVNLTDLGGKVGYQQMPFGAVLTVDFTSSNYTTVVRPNVAPNVRVWWIGDATTSSSTLPVNAVTGDVIDTAA